MFVSKKRYLALEKQANKQEVLIKELQEKLSPLTSIEDAVHKEKEKLSECRSTYKEKRELLDKLVDRVDIYSEKLFDIDMGLLDLPGDMNDSGYYAARLRECRNNIKDMAKRFKKEKKEYYVDKMDSSAWFVQVSKFNIDTAKHSAKQMNVYFTLKNNQLFFLHFFNALADQIIAKTTYRNYDLQKRKLLDAEGTVSSFVSYMYAGITKGDYGSEYYNFNQLFIVLNQGYVKQKQKELKLTYKHALAKNIEKEKLKEEKQAERDRKKAETELKKTLKREKDYQDQLDKAKSLAAKMHGQELEELNKKISALETELAKTSESKKRAESLAQLTKAGYVYIISNKGSFGEDIVKIGLTRRIDPNERVKELGDASVPFRFDTHAIIYSENAPALESALHRKFSEGRVNKVNMRKEFFHADIEEVKSAVMELAHDANFVTDAESAEYFQTLHLATVDQEKRQTVNLDDLPLTI